MAVVRSEPVTQAKMNALADLANAKISPDWKSNPDPYFFPPLAALPAPAAAAGIISYGGANNYIAEGQPVTAEIFAFKNVAGGKSYSNQGAIARVTMDNSGRQATIHWSWPAVAGADGYLVKISPVNGPPSTPAYFAQTNDTTFDDVTYIFPFTGGVAYQFDGAEDVAVGLQIDPRSWLHQVNRIRADFWNGFFNDDAAGIFLDPAARLSGPWIVATNDPIAYPLVDAVTFGPVQVPFSWQGELIGSLPADMAPAGEFICYHGVRFYFAIDDAPGEFSVGTGRRITTGLHTGGADAQNLVLDYNAQLGGHCRGTIRWTFEWTGAGPAPAVPAAAAFNPVATPGAGITWRTYADLVDGHYWIEADVDVDIAPGAGEIHFTLAPPADFQMSTPPGLGGAEAWIVLELIFSSVAVQTAATIIHPASAGAYIAADDMPDNSQFTVQGFPAQAIWKISDATVPGCWSAMTLPAPAINVFIDQDMPPYVASSRLANGGGNIAVAADIVDGLMNHPALPFASSMREASSVRSIDNNNYATTNPDWGIMASGISPRPAPWLVLRDTDPQPSTWGFEVNKHLSSLNDIVQGTDRTDPPKGIFIFPISTKLKIRVYEFGAQVQAWDKTPLNNKPLTIKVWNGSNPDVDPPFAIGINEITIPPDGVLAPVDEIWSITVENPAAGPEEFTRYQLFVEIDDVGALPYPIFFPQLEECFSYCLSGAAFEGSEFAGADRRNKFIPQNGYCIFKIRATRPPVDNAAGIALPAAAGPAVDVDIGIMRLGNFTKIQTITIPADVATSGDVSVFWPVIAGQEIRWRCAQPVIVEAWGNFQPLFFSKFYSGMSFQMDGLTPTAFSQALNFANQFDAFRANYISLGEQATKVQFPLFAELYNDLEAVLNLI